MCGVPRIAECRIGLWSGMEDSELLMRVSLDPAVMAGKPVVRGTRLSVERMLNLLAHGMTPAEILDEYDGLEPEDIQACLLFASKSLQSNDFMPLGATPE